MILVYTFLGERCDERCDSDRHLRPARYDVGDHQFGSDDLILRTKRFCGLNRIELQLTKHGNVF